MILYKTKESEIVRVDGGSDKQSLKKYSTTIIGDGIKTVFTIEHHLDTEDIIFEMNDEEGLIFTDYNVADNNTVNIIFSIAPLTEEKYSVTIYGVDGSSNGSGGNNSSSTSPVISGVSGIKGSAESKFRTGDVTISPQDLGLDADTYAKKSIYGDTNVSLGRKTNTAIGIRSFAFGRDIEATGEHSHAVGYGITASGDYSHAEGTGIIASGFCCHAEGYATKARSDYSYAEGYGSEAIKEYSHAEGHATKAGGYASHAECFITTASGNHSHASGRYTIARGDDNFACGRYNVDKDVLFSIGNGTYMTARANAFSVSDEGIVKAASTITASTTADYAEFFEWEDANSNNEDRVGKFVTTNGEKISIATSNEDYILGIVSGQPFVLGNGDCDTWNKMYLRDDFGRIITEPAPKIELQINDKTGEITEKQIIDQNGNLVYEGTRPKLNPDYDSSKPYISRFERQEWSPIGMLGVLSVWQDGSLEVNGYCCCNSEGIATSCGEDTKNSYRVVKIISDNVARVILK